MPKKKYKNLSEDELLEYIENFLKKISNHLSKTEKEFEKKNIPHGYFINFLYNSYLGFGVDMVSYMSSQCGHQPSGILLNISKDLLFKFHEKYSQSSRDQVTH